MRGPAAIFAALLVFAAPAFPAQGATPFASELRDLHFLPQGGPAFPYPYTAALLLLLGAGSLLLSRKRSPEPERSAEPTENPAAALDRLGARLPDAPDEIAAFYRELSWLLRGALERKTSLPAGRLTTGEFLSRARAGGALGLDEELLAARCLELCDRVKFAGHLPAPEESGRCYRSVRLLVLGEERRS